MESVPEHGKVGLSRFLNKNDVDSFNENGFLRNELIRLCIDLKQNKSRTD